MSECNKRVDTITEKGLGKPIVNGTRNSVYDGLSWLPPGITPQETNNENRGLPEVRINACLPFAAGGGRTSMVCIMNLRAGQNFSSRQIMRIRAKSPETKEAIKFFAE